MTQPSPSPALSDEDPREALARALDPMAFASWAEHYAMAAKHGDPEKACRSFAEWGSSGACTRAREAADRMIADPLSLSKAVLRAGAAEARATAAEAALLEKDGEIERLKAALKPFSILKFSFDGFSCDPAALVFLGREIGEWWPIQHAAFDKMIEAARAALAPTEPLPATDDEASHVSGS